MQAGSLRHRITIETMAEQRDVHGGIVETWVPLMTVWASVEPLRSTEIFRAAQVDARITHRVTMRYQPGLTSLMSVVYKGQRLQILGPPANEYGRNRLLEFLAMEAPA